MTNTAKQFVQAVADCAAKNRWLTVKGVRGLARIITLGESMVVYGGRGWAIKRCDALYEGMAGAELNVSVGVTRLGRSRLHHPFRKRSLRRRDYDFIDRTIVTDGIQDMTI